MSFYVGAFVGFRSWKMSDTGLTSAVMRQEEWSIDGPTQARCIEKSGLCIGKAIPHNGICPHPRCNCGLHAFHNLNSALEEFTAHHASVVGSAVFWGRMQVHTNGLRAEFARPVAFIKERNRKTKRLQERNADFNSRLEQISALYQLPVLPIEDLVEYTKTFGDLAGEQLDD